MPFFPELKLEDESFIAELNEFLEFIGNRSLFFNLNDNDKQKLAFTLPIPPLKNFTETHYWSSDQAVSMGSDEAGVFKIHGERFEYEDSNYESSNLFSTPIWMKNQLIEEQFISQFVQPFLNRRVDYNELYAKLQYRYSSLHYFQGSGGSHVFDDNDVISALDCSLYYPTQTPILASFEEFANEISKNLGTYLIEKGVVEKRAGHCIPLTPYSTNLKHESLKYLGMSTRPSVIYGLKLAGTPWAIATGLGYMGIKVPTLKLKESYDKLYRVIEDKDICFDKYGVTKGMGLVLELQKVIRKYTTICVHTGCDRFIITDYESFLFVHLNKNVSLMSEDQNDADEIEEEEKEEASVSSLGEKNSTPHVDEQVSTGEIAPKIVGNRKKTTGPVKSNREETDSKNSAYFISSRHFLVSRLHPNIRLYVAAFFAMNEERMGDMKLFQKDVVNFMNCEKNRIEEIERNKLAISLTKQETLVNRPRTRSAVALHDRDFDFKPELFKNEYKLDMGPICIKALQLYSYIVSQLITIDSRRFMEKISTDNQFHQSKVSKTTMLKIYDPLWGEELKDFYTGGFTYTYQYAIKRCVGELEIYQKLKPLMGTIVPRVYSYGRLSDIHVCSGQSYIRFWGPFIQLKHFERDETFTKDSFTKTFVENSVIPAFKKLHKCGVVQNDIRSHNIIVTTKGEVKIINFSHAKCTKSEQDFEEEIAKIRYCVWH